VVTAVGNKNSYAIFCRKLAGKQKRRSPHCSETNAPRWLNDDGTRTVFQTEISQRESKQKRSAYFFWPGSVTEFIKNFHVLEYYHSGRRNLRHTHADAHTYTTKDGHVHWHRKNMCRSTKPAYIGHHFAFQRIGIRLSRFFDSFTLPECSLSICSSRCFLELSPACPHTTTTTTKHSVHILSTSKTRWPSPLHVIGSKMYIRTRTCVNVFTCKMHRNDCWISNSVHARMKHLAEW
jgi:hypothetical protein